MNTFIYSLMMAALVASSAGAETNSAVSPDGNTRIDFNKDSPSLPTFTVSRKGQQIISKSALGIRISGQDFGANGFDLVDIKSKQVKDIYEMVLGKAKVVPDHYTELTLTFRETGTQKTMSVIARAYDGGVALRYVLPKQAGFETFSVSGEWTEFLFPKDYNCWGMNPGKFQSSQEAEFDRVKASLIRQYNLFVAPLVCKTGNGETTFALAESDVKNYPGAFFSRKNNNDLGVMVKFPQRLEGGPVAKIVQDGTEFKTPWRVVMIGDNPRQLVESTLIPTLGEPTKIKDTSWIKGGKSAWDWWNNYNAPVAKAGVNTETYLAYIDHAHALGLDYILMDEGWYTGFSEQPKKGSNVIKPVPEIDIQKIIAYGSAKNVRVMIWLQWQQLDWQLDEALATYEKWGIAGIKVDFMDRSDQDMVNFYHKLLGKAAEHKILVDLHGAYAPNGLLRTYPNFVTQEGVLGGEYNKWSSRITAEHNVTLPFTRMILGPIDYTPGAMRNLTPETFERSFNMPYVMTTRGQGIAMYVVYDSPVTMVSDAPQSYKKADGSWEDGVDFIRDVPTTWDETRVVQGDIGEYIVTARRKGGKWYVGAMTNEMERTLTIPVNFLREGKFKASIWQDGATPTQLVKSTETLSSTSELTLKLAPSGGAAVIIEKLD